MKAEEMGQVGTPCVSPSRPSQPLRLWGSYLPKSKRVLVHTCDLPAAGRTTPREDGSCTRCFLWNAGVRSQRIPRGGVILGRRKARCRKIKKNCPPLQSSSVADGGCLSCDSRATSSFMSGDPDSSLSHPEVGLVEAENAVIP